MIEGSTYSIKLENTIFTIYFDERDGELKPGGLIVTMTNPKGEHLSWDKIPYYQCRDLADMLLKLET